MQLQGSRLPARQRGLRPPHQRLLLPEAACSDITSLHCSRGLKGVGGRGRSRFPKVPGEDALGQWKPRPSVPPVAPRLRAALKGQGGLGLPATLSPRLAGPPRSTVTPNPSQGS